MFLFDEASLIEKEKGALMSEHGRIIQKSEAETLTRDYFDRLMIMGRKAQEIVHFDPEVEPIALLYHKSWFELMFEEGAEYIRIYFGLFEGRHTVLFVGADDKMKDKLSKDNTYYIVEDGTVCCPKKRDGCANQLSLFKEV